VAILLVIIGDYLLVDINGDFMNGYWYLFYWWLLVVILSYILTINDFCIISYCWLFYDILWPLMIIQL
jgi:hypothetical protein